GFYYLAGGLFALALFLLFGYRACVRLGPDHVMARTTLWGLPMWSRTIPRKHLEEISVRGRSSGSFLQLVSDERIINLRIMREDVAAWLASRLRHELASQEPTTTAAR